MEIILQYVATIAPALIAILGIAATVVAALHKLSSAIKEWKKDASLAETSSQLQRLTEENHELVRCNKLLLDKITQIEGYADEVKKK